MDYLEIEFLDPKEQDKRVCSHVDLEAIINQIKGMHRQALANELRLMFANYLKNGNFGFSYDVLDYIHGAYARKQLTKIIRGCSRVVKMYSAGHSVIRREFTFAGVVKKAPTYKGRDGCSRLVVATGREAWRIITAEWLSWRYEQWCDFCLGRGLSQKLDIGGRTDWGAATFDALESVSLPACAASEHGQAKIDKLASGVPRMAKRNRGRVYHPLTNLAKDDRKNILIDGHRVGDIDLRGSYTTLITSLLPKEPQGPILDKMRAEKWYAQFRSIYDQWMPRKIEEMRGEGATEEEIAERFKNGVKGEYQRQCLFWHDERDRPLWNVLVANHSELAFLIDCLHRKYGPSGFSDILTRAESALFVDDALPALAKMGIKSICIHDAMIVTIDNLDAVRGVLERLGLEHLGFVPSFAVKVNGQPYSQETPPVPMSTVDRNLLGVMPELSPQM